MKVRGIGTVVLAWLAAASVGAVVVTVELSIFSLLKGLSTGIAEITSNWWVVPLALLSTFVGFLAGLLILGAPAWWVVTGLGRTGRLDAVLTVAGLSAVVGFCLIQLGSEKPLSWPPFVCAAIMILPGSAAGWTLHRVAYGKTPA